MAGASSATIQARDPGEVPALTLLSDTDAAAALLNPDRRRVLETLGSGERPGDSAAGVAGRLGLPRQKVNYHVRELERLGLVELVEERRKGNCLERIVRARATTYAMDPAMLGALSPDPAREPDRRSAAYMIAVAARTIAELGELLRRAARAKKRISTLTIDAEVRFASAKDQSDFGEELARTVAQLVSKYHDEGSPNGRTFRVVAGAYQAITKPEDDPADGPAPTGEVR
ncbi:MAG: helix-turn-helix domain-containing protein [Phycisphaerales bacterium]